MKLEIRTPAYNARKRGEPYIAKVDFYSARGYPTWGRWIGRAGEPGLLVLECRPGDVVMRGQRNSRNMLSLAPTYYIVGDDMVLRECTRADAYLAWQYHSGPPDATMLGEP